MMDHMIIKLPSFCLVCLVGISGSGKTTFARRHFQVTQILSSDHFRALIADDESDQSVSADAFSCLYHLAKKRLKHKRLTVIDATSVQKRARLSLLKMAQAYQCPAIAIVLSPPLARCQKMNLTRPRRQTPPEVVAKQHRELLESLPLLASEGFAGIYHLQSPREIAEVKIVRASPPQLA
ncbi:MAG: AAA family ATPase [Deltaproteobacteria bacterium]|jgi:predicted kinase|nr:AAA family ATPase [Deltaproteobacteria bacterium]